VAFLLQACGPSARTPEPAAPPAGQDAADAAQSSAPGSTPAKTGVSLVEDGDYLQFRYTWPAEAAAIEKLNARLQADAKTRKQHGLNVAKADAEARRPQGAPMHPHTAIKAWAVEGDTPRLLALRDDMSEYTGGAHGMSGFEAILWDRSRDRDIATTDLFADKAAALALLKQAFCPALDKERARKRGEPAPNASKEKSSTDDWMNACPDLTQQVLIPSNVTDGRFHAIRVLIAPYEAGPYAEGTYQVTLPITEQLAALVKPEYRDTIAAAPGSS
jgi:hypothetical protein